jgi:hypothetical protein
VASRHIKKKNKKNLKRKNKEKKKKKEHGAGHVAVVYSFGLADVAERRATQASASRRTGRRRSPGRAPASMYPAAGDRLRVLGGL